MIKTMLNRLEHLKNQPTDKKRDVSTNPNHIDKTNNNTPSFAAIFAATNTLTQINLVLKKTTKMAQPLLLVEQRKLKKFRATKPFEGNTIQETYSKVNKALMEVNAKQDNNPIQISLWGCQALYQDRY
ncbi:hypothetical protein O181_072601 [Austropuccinia psidii MF-1]|uniref:Uncharacterized protein n=1 Tax=Austropuccinia psidii MF-1 TaxID=1389203 RepID=A0A9Q3I7J4_9BASI|nr:hypothetical protein [Austropuccinia psidii MF-1]